MTQTLLNADVIGLICDEPPAGMKRTRWNTPVYRPIIHQQSSPEEITSVARWDAMDAFASSVITSRLTETAEAHLGNLVNAAGEWRTARQAYENLWQACQTVPDLSACLSIQRCMLETRCIGFDVEKFVTTWSQHLTMLENYGYTIPWLTVTLTFISHFPNAIEYHLLVHDLTKILNDTPDATQALFDLCAKHLISTCNSYIAGRKDNNGKEKDNMNANTNSNNTDSNQKHRRGNRSNMKNLNEQSNNTNNMNTALIATTDTSKIQDVTDVFVLTEDCNEISRSSYAVSYVNNQSKFDPSSYLSPKLSTLTQLEIDEPSTFAMITCEIPTLLDSGCTNHIIQNWNHFFSYDINGALNVKTANAGNLSTLASGNCYYKIPIIGWLKHLMLEMHDCLHALNIPVNLLSTSTMLEKHFSFYMSKKEVRVYIPGTDRLFALADIKRRLCFMRGELLKNDAETRFLRPCFHCYACLCTSHS